MTSSIPEQPARVVREMLPKAHFASVNAKPAGRPMVDTFVTEVSQDLDLPALGYGPCLHAADPRPGDGMRGSSSPRLWGEGTAEEAAVAGLGFTMSKSGSGNSDMTSRLQVPDPPEP
jgi:hypothetical protein